MKARARVDRLEKILEEEINPKLGPIFVWADNAKEAEKELKKLSPGERERAIVFSWQGEIKSGPEGPTGPIESKLSPELQKRIDELYECPPDHPKGNAVEKLEEEISKTVEDLRKSGISQKEIEEVFGETSKPNDAEEEEQDHLVRLTGGRRRKRFSIDEG